MSKKTPMVKDWDLLANEYRSVGGELLTQLDGVTQALQVFKEVIDNDEEVKAQLLGAKLTLEHLGLVMQATAFEHSVPLHAYKRELLLKTPELFTLVKVTTETGDITFIEVSDPVKFKEDFEKCVEDHLKKAGFKDVMNYTLLCAGEKYGLGDKMIINPTLPTYAFRKGIITTHDTANLDFDALATRYAVITHDIATVGSTVYIDILPALGLNPEHRELVQEIGESANLVMKTLNFKK